MGWLCARTVHKSCDGPAVTRVERTESDALFTFRLMASCVPSTARSTSSLRSCPACSLPPSQPESVSLALAYSDLASSLACSAPSRAESCASQLVNARAM